LVLAGGESSGGTPLNRLGLEAGSLEAVLEAAAGSGDSVRIGVGSSGAGGGDKELGFLCRTCKRVWSSEGAARKHEGCGEGGRPLRMMSKKGFGCGECEAVLESAAELQSHHETHHQLSVEMEDVVNQITALAAKAAAAESDSNANLFCPPPQPKLYPVPSTGQ
jgi:hypothetical protein